MPPEGPVQVLWEADGQWYDAQAGPGVLSYGDGSFELSRSSRGALETWQDGQWRPVRWRAPKEQNGEAQATTAPATTAPRRLWVQTPGRGFRAATFDGERLLFGDTGPPVDAEWDGGFYAGGNRLAMRVGAARPRRDGRRKPLRSRPRKTRRPVALESHVRAYEVRSTTREMLRGGVVDAEATRRAADWVDVCHGVLQKHQFDSEQLNEEFFGKSRLAYEVLDTTGRTHCFALVAPGYAGHAEAAGLRRTGESPLRDSAEGPLMELVLVCSDTTGNRCGSRVLQRALDDLRPGQILVAEAAPSALGFYARHGFAPDARAGTPDLEAAAERAELLTPAGLLRVYRQAPPRRSSVAGRLLAVPGYLIARALGKLGVY